MNGLLNKVNYLNTNISPFFISSFIREYDMRQSNISVLRYKGIITNEEFEYYSNLPKLERQIKIGLLQKEKPEIAKVITNTMTELRNTFITQNNLNITNVISIKNDAFFIMPPFPVNTIVADNIEFRVKNIYTSYYLFNKDIPGPKVECYYYLNRIVEEEVLDVKGISDESLSLHENHFIDLLKTVFYSAETESREETINLLTTIYESYITRKMDIEYYREFNADSKYRLCVGGMYFTADVMNGKDIEYVDITVNLNILRQLLSFYSYNYKPQIK